MTLRPIALLAVLLLAACSSDKPKPAPTPQASRSVTMVEPVLPAHLRELSGTLSSIQGSLPRGSEVQMALLVIDERDRPQRLLASETVLATGELMPFRLPFNPESFPPAGGALRVELHAGDPVRPVGLAPASVADRPADHPVPRRTAPGTRAVTAPQALTQALGELLGDARLSATALPGTDLRLWLIDAQNMDRQFSPEETRRILEEPPYWCFCWASGLVLARWLAARPQWVRDKRVLDFGSGSGVAAIAAARAGAAEVVACDLDPLALAASRANAELNGVELSYSADFFAEDDRFDLILVADVLYDRANLPLLDQFLSRGRQALVADSRVRDFRHPLYRRLDVLEACTWPDLAEPAEFRLVSLYHAERGQA